jgi:hypothetical protein
MRQAQYARCVRAEFIRDPLRPAEACTQDGTGGAVDRRLWDGPTGVSCGKQWTKIKEACIKFHACGERIRRMELTGAPTKEDIARCVLALYHLGAGVTSRLYDVVRAKSYPVGKEFPYMQATLNSAYRPEMPNRAEIRGTVGAEFSAHAFQSFHSLSFHFRTVWLFPTTLGCCDAS